MSAKRHKSGFGPEALNGLGRAHLPTALAVGALVLLPALGWQAGGVPSTAVAATAGAGLSAAAVTRSVSVTVIGKRSLTWEHKKSNRMAAAPEMLQSGVIEVPGQPETVVEVISLDGSQESASLPGDVMAEEQGSADPSANLVDRQAYADWLSFDDASGQLRITGFATQRAGGGRKACRDQHDTIVRAFEVPGALAKVMADQPVMFQSRICAANGEIIITCHGSTALVSPRQLRPGSACARS